MLPLSRPRSWRLYQKHFNNNNHCKDSNKTATTTQANNSWTMSLHTVRTTSVTFAVDMPKQHVFRQKTKWKHLFPLWSFNNDYKNSIDDENKNKRERCDYRLSNSLLRVALRPLPAAASPGQLAQYANPLGDPRRKLTSSAVTPILPLLRGCSPFCSTLHWRILDTSQLFQITTEIEAIVVHSSAQ